MSDETPCGGGGDVDVAGYRFISNTACIVCVHVMDGQPILLFTHDSDGDLQFLCGASDHVTEDGRIDCLHCLIQAHPEVSTLPRVDLGMRAWRDDGATVWAVEPREEDEEE
jgi:hypothetical protein